MYTIKKIVEYKRDKNNADRLSSVFEKALEVIDKKNLEAPSRKLIHRMGPADIIILPDTESLTAEQAKGRYPRRARAKHLTGTFDATYKIKNIDLDQIPLELTIDYDGFEFKAAAELANKDIGLITDSFENAWKAQDSLMMQLHVFIVYSDKRIISASIVGIGPPRENTGDIQELIQQL